MNKSVVIATSICVAVAGVVLAAKLNDATKINQQLNAEVNQLKDRIGMLEAQLKMSSRASGNVQPAVVIKHTAPMYAYDAFDPFGVFNSINQQMTQILDDSFYGPQMDIQEKNDQYVITIDIPGMQKQDIKVEVHNGTLVVSGTRNEQKKQKDDKDHYYRQERSFGKFMRTIPLPEDAKTDSVNAEYKEGVLIVTVAKNKPVPAQGNSSQVIVK